MRQRNDLVIATTALDPITEHVKNFGKLDVETGGFLLAERAKSARITVIALTGQTGVHRARDQFRISGPAIESLFLWSEEHDFQVRAQFHAHPLRAFLSGADERLGFCVEGFQTSIIPGYADPPRRPEEWGWWTFASGSWLPIAAPRTTRIPSCVVVFDEDGVREP